MRNFGLTNRLNLFSFLELVKSPTFEIFKSHLAIVLDNHIYMTLLHQRVGPYDLQKARLTSNML